MIVDLVSSWCAAAEAADSLRARDLFRARHAPVLELLRGARTPLLEALPLAADVDLLRSIARRAADPALQQQIRDILVRAAELGAGEGNRVVLLAGDGTGDEMEPLPWPEPAIVLFLDRVENDDVMTVALARASAALTRWTAPDSHALVTLDRTRGWDRWRSAGNVPLREWIYTEGLGLHLAQALRPGLPAHQLLGVTLVALGRLRQREKVLAALLATDLNQCGIGLILRWLTPGAPSGPRTVGDIVLPPMAGRYLAWRMLEERMARVGLREAIRMAA